MKERYFTLLFIALLVVSCTSADRLVSSYDFPEGSWNKFNNPVLRFQIKNPGVYYDMYLGLKFDPSYNQEDFQITVIMTAPGGEVRSRDIITDLSSADHSGSLANIKIKLRKEYAFSEQGECIFEIENRSSRLNTPGMKKISIILERPQ